MVVMTDQTIIALYNKRDQQALEETEKAYGGLCRNLARRILRDPQDAEECVNDSLLRLWQRIPPDSPDSLGSYLSRILRNLCLDRLRQQGALKRGGAAVTVCLTLWIIFCGPSPRRHAAFFCAGTISLTNAPRSRRGTASRPRRSP